MGRWNFLGRSAGGIIASIIVGSTDRRGSFAFCISMVSPSSCRSLLGGNTEGLAGKFQRLKSEPADSDYGRILLGLCIGHGCHFLAWRGCQFGGEAPACVGNANFFV